MGFGEWRDVEIFVGMSEEGNDFLISMGKDIERIKNDEKVIILKMRMFFFFVELVVELR